MPDLLCEDDSEVCDALDTVQEDIARAFIQESGLGLGAALDYLADGELDQEIQMTGTSYSSFFEYSDEYLCQEGDYNSDDCSGHTREESGRFTLIPGVMGMSQAHEEGVNVIECRSVREEHVSGDVQHLFTVRFGPILATSFGESFGYSVSHFELSDWSGLAVYSEIDPTESVYDNTVENLDPTISHSIKSGAKDIDLLAESIISAERWNYSDESENTYKYWEVGQSDLVVLSNH